MKARLISARAQARRARIVPTGIEQQLGTRYTVDTLGKLIRRYPKRRFVWLMGADNLAQLHRWKDWRRLARTMPIAVVARPGYDAQALASPAMAWLRRYRVPAASIRKRGQWSAPAWCYCVSIQTTARPRRFAVPMPGGPSAISAQDRTIWTKGHRCVIG